MKIIMRGKKVGVEKVSKSNKKETSMFVVPESVASTGIIRYIDPELKTDLKVGQKVHFGSKRERIVMGSIEVEVMEEDNIVAIIEENDESVEKTA